MIDPTLLCSPRTNTHFVGVEATQNCTGKREFISSYWPPSRSSNRFLQICISSRTALQTRGGFVSVLIYSESRGFEHHDGQRNATRYRVVWRAGALPGPELCKVSGQAVKVQDASNGPRRPSLWQHIPNSTFTTRTVGEGSG